MNDLITLLKNNTPPDDLTPYHSQILHNINNNEPYTFTFIKNRLILAYNADHNSNTAINNFLYNHIISTIPSQSDFTFRLTLDLIEHTHYWFTLNNIHNYLQINKLIYLQLLNHFLIHFKKSKRSDHLLVELNTIIETLYDTLIRLLEESNNNHINNNNCNYLPLLSDTFYYLIYQDIHHLFEDYNLINKLFFYFHKNVELISFIVRKYPEYVEADVVIEYLIQEIEELEKEDKNNDINTINTNNNTINNTITTNTITNTITPTNNISTSSSFIPSYYNIIHTITNRHSLNNNTIHTLSTLLYNHLNKRLTNKHFLSSLNNDTHLKEIIQYDRFNEHMYFLIKKYYKKEDYELILINRLFVCTVLKKKYEEVYGSRLFMNSIKGESDCVEYVFEEKEGMVYIVSSNSRSSENVNSRSRSKSMNSINNNSNTIHTFTSTTNTTINHLLAESVYKYLIVNKILTLPFNFNSSFSKTYSYYKFKNNQRIKNIDFFNCNLNSEIDLFNLSALVYYLNIDINTEELKRLLLKDTLTERMTFYIFDILVMKNEDINNLYEWSEEIMAYYSLYCGKDSDYRVMCGKEDVGFGDGVPGYWLKRINKE